MITFAPRWSTPVERPSTRILELQPGKRWAIPRPKPVAFRKFVDRHCADESVDRPARLRRAVFLIAKYGRSGILRLNLCLEICGEKTPTSVKSAFGARRENIAP